MDKHLETIAASYDDAIERGKLGLPDQYSELPKHITDDPIYKVYLSSNYEGSERKLIKTFLKPNKNKKFVDLGCCLNLMLKGYDKWKSKYYGVDISEKTVALLNDYVKNNKLDVGGIICCGIDNTCFLDNTFDIGACIGVLEYFEEEYIYKALNEFYRILKPSAKMVLDVPNLESKYGKFMMAVEDSIGRKDKFDLSIEKFEILLNKFFYIIKRDEIGEDTPMINYYLISKK